MITMVNKGIVQVPPSTKSHRGNKDDHRKTVHKGIVQVPQEVIPEAGE